MANDSWIEGQTGIIAYLVGATVGDRFGHATPDIDDPDRGCAPFVAAVAQADLDLERTRVRAPFDAHVIRREANVGSQVDPGDELAHLVGVDTSWVETTVPLSKLRWLEIPNREPGGGGDAGDPETGMGLRLGAPDGSSATNTFRTERAGQIGIYRVGSQSPLEIASTVESVMSDFETTLPPGVSWRIDGNQADDFQERLSLLVENGLAAILIVLIILTLFLEFQLAFWVMMGMTVSFVGSLIFLPMVGVSINMVSMFAFLVVLGVVVDDAIVVGENVGTTRVLAT